MIQHSEYESIHVLYDNDARHYEYFGRERREETAVTGKTKETEGTRGAMQEGREGKQGTEDKKARKEEDRGHMENQTIQRPNPTVAPEGVRTAQTRREIGKQTLQIYIGALNVSGIAYGYRGRYIKTEEDLLKIRPGEIVREVTEMIKTQGVGVMTLTDTHLGKEGMEEVRTYLR
eukprot:405600-Pleurochrysis_carterae.AAC.1